MWNNYVLDKTLKSKCPEILQLIPNVFIFSVFRGFSSSHILASHILLLKTGICNFSDDYKISSRKQMFRPCDQVIYYLAV